MGSDGAMHRRRRPNGDGHTALRATFHVSAHAPLAVDVALRHWLALAKYDKRQQRKGPVMINHYV